MAESTYIDNYATLAQYLIDCGERCFLTTADRLNYGDIILVATKETENPGILGRLGVFAGLTENGNLLLRSYPPSPRPTGEIDVDPIAANNLPYQTLHQDTTATHEVPIEPSAALIILDAKHDPDLAYSNWELDRVAADLQQNIAKDLSLLQVPDSQAFFDVNSKALLFVKDLENGAGLLLVEKKTLAHASKLVAWRVGNPQRVRC